MQTDAQRARLREECDVAFYGNYDYRIVQVIHWPTGTVVENPCGHNGADEKPAVQNALDSLAVLLHRRFKTMQTDTLTVAQGPQGGGYSDEVAVAHIRFIRDNGYCPSCGLDKDQARYGGCAFYKWFQYLPDADRDRLKTLARERPADPDAAPALPSLRERAAALYAYSEQQQAEADAQAAAELAGRQEQEVRLAVVRARLATEAEVIHWIPFHITTDDYDFTLLMHDGLLFGMWGYNNSYPCLYLFTRCPQCGVPLPVGEAVNINALGRALTRVDAVQQAHNDSEQAPAGQPAARLTVLTQAEQLEALITNIVADSLMRGGYITP